jgi:polysaccharide pyruvyl transferase WcaK-like protein
MECKCGHRIQSQEHPITILFSSTRGWNCGDEFILRGLRNLIDDLGVLVNPVIYNRHPDLLLYEFFKDVPLFVNTPKGQTQVNIDGALRTFSCRVDNSLRLSHDIGFVDACIFAGTPEWLGVPVEKIAAKLAASKIPVAYVGVGYGDYQNSAANALGDLDATILRRAGLVTTRDQRAYDFLARHNITAQVLPCPALFTCRDEKRVEQVRRIAISVQNPDGAGPQTVSPQTSAWLLDFAKLAATEYEVVFVQHYIDEFAHMASDLRALGPVLYSSDPNDYQAFYRSADITVTSRVHGAGICASLGIPGYFVGDTLRTDTVAGFLSEVIPVRTTPPAALLDRIRNTDIAAWSQKIIDHKKITHAEYMRLLGKFVSTIARPVADDYASNSLISSQAARLGANSNSPAFKSG